MDSVDSSLSIDRILSESDSKSFPVWDEFLRVAADIPSEFRAEKGMSARSRSRAHRTDTKEKRTGGGTDFKSVLHHYKTAVTPLVLNAEGVANVPKNVWKTGNRFISRLSEVCEVILPRVSIFVFKNKCDLGMHAF